MIGIMVNICKCNNCESYLIDQNPKQNAPEYVKSDEEIEMQYFGGGVKDKDGNSDGYWGCPICLTDEYLTDEF